MRLFYVLILLTGFTSIAQGQKNPAFKPLKKIYGKTALKIFEQENGSLDLLYYAYDHAVQVIQNNGGKNLDEFPIAPNTTIVHFTDLGIKIEPFTQYFKSENQNVLIAVKSLYQLQLEFTTSNHSKH
ncbi:MAG: hypothetical protein ACKO4Y_08215 [Flavobacteriales bacterium]